jgi:flagellum-specific ATP synthase
MSAELAEVADIGVVFSKYRDIVRNIDPIKFTGIVDRVTGLLIESRGPQAVIGELCRILLPDGDRGVWAEVVGLSKNMVQLMPYDDMEGIEVGCTVVATGGPLMIPVSDGLLGRVLDSMGRPIDDRGITPADTYRKVTAVPPSVLRRRRITERIVTGVRAIDAMTPVGKGQRLGIFSGSGVGKSTLLGMIARNTSADINVIALIGERGREVREFIENDLGSEGLARSVIVVSTSDTPPLARLTGAYVATTIAEYFRDQGKDVMFLFDSVTRFARAQREIGLSVGEPPATRGYTPSVFSLLPKLLERCGTSENGTITGFYTILVDGDDVDEPISDNVRGILDGHLILSRRLASSNQYPAVDVLQSLSRLAPRVTGKEERRAVGIVRRLLATYMEAEDLINVGAYVAGTNASIDEAMDKIETIRAFLAQGIDESVDIADTLDRLAEISGVHLNGEQARDEAVPVST